MTEKSDKATKLFFKIREIVREELTLFKKELLQELRDSGGEATSLLDSKDKSLYESMKNRIHESVTPKANNLMSDESLVLYDDAGNPTPVAHKKEAVDTFNRIMQKDYSKLI